MCAGRPPALSWRAGGSHGEAGGAAEEDRASGGRLQAVLGSAQSGQTGKLNMCGEEVSTGESLPEDQRGGADPQADSSELTGLSVCLLEGAGSCDVYL